MRARRSTTLGPRRRLAAKTPSSTTFMSTGYRRSGTQPPPQAQAAASTAVLAAACAWGGGWVPLRLYPVLMNVVLLGVFAASLRRGPSVVERLARMREPDLPPRAVAYTRRVT